MKIRTGDGDRVNAYCPNTSRLIGLLDGSPGVLMTRNDDDRRSTNYTVRCIRDNGVWVGIEASRANDWFKKYLKNPDRNHYTEWNEWSSEVELGQSRIDFVRSGTPNSHWVEVKSLSSRSSDGMAFYSGTPSRRGYRHLAELEDAVARGERCDLVFVVQRSDVEGVAPSDVTEKGWLQSLRSADRAGVRIRAFRCRREGPSWEITREIPTYL